MSLRLTSFSHTTMPALPGIVVCENDVSRSDTRHLSAYDLKTGDPLWRQSYKKGHHWARTHLAIPANETMVFSRGEAIRGHCLETGGVIWHARDEKLADSRGGGPIAATNDQVVCAGFEGDHGVVVLLDSRDGHKVSEHQAMSGHIGALACDDLGRRVLVSSGASIYAIDVTRPPATVQKKAGGREQGLTSANGEKLAALLRDLSLDPGMTASLVQFHWIVAGESDSNVSLFDLAREYVVSKLVDQDAERWIRYLAILAARFRWIVRGQDGDMFGRGREAGLFCRELHRKDAQDEPLGFPHTPATGAYPAHLTCLALSPSGERVVSAGNDGKVVIWKIARPRRTLDLAVVPSRPGYLDGPSPVFSITPDGRRIVTAARLHWDMESSQGDPNRHDSLADNAAVSVSPDGRFAASLRRGRLAVWPLDAEADLWSVACEEPWGPRVAWSADASLVFVTLSASQEAMLEVRDARSGVLVTRCLLPPLFGHRNYRISIAPDSTTLVVQDSWRKDKVWFLRIENVPVSSPILTAFQRPNADEFQVLCPFCLTRISLGALGGRIVCPCGKDLRINPFATFDPLLGVGDLASSSGPPDRKPATEAAPVEILSFRGHHGGDPDRATRLNLEYQRRLADWKALSGWKRIRTKRPEPPKGI